MKKISEETFRWFLFSLLNTLTEILLDQDSHTKMPKYSKAKRDSFNDLIRLFSLSNLSWQLKNLKFQRSFFEKNTFLTFS